MEILIFWLFFSFVAAMLASKKGRSAFGFFLLSILLSQLIGVIAALIANKNNTVIEEKLISSGKEKKCPYCAEVIRSEAIVCRFCGRDLPKESAPSHVDRSTVVNLGEYDTLGDLINYANKPGYSKAKYLLGMLYLEGKVVDVNITEGTKLIKQAADEGYSEAISQLSMLSNESA